MFRLGQWVGHDVVVSRHFITSAQHVSNVHLGIILQESWFHQREEGVFIREKRVCSVDVCIERRGCVLWMFVLREEGVFCGCLY